MIPTRYPAPAATQTFADNRRFILWTQISRAYAFESIRASDQPEEDQDVAFRAITNLVSPVYQQVATREMATGHDVVAFLSLLEQQLPAVAKRHLHLGLTSSDLVDTAMFIQLRDHSAEINNLLVKLQRAMSRWDSDHTTRPGRTHGQIADLTSWSHQMFVYKHVLAEIENELFDYARRGIMKSPGPTGRSNIIPLRGMAVAGALNLEEIPSTQVIPRDYLVRWAALYVRLAGILENVAVLVRAGARSEVAEVAEGATRVGSSSMPQKRNPIDSEKICGLARMARGYFSVIMESSALWEDRDISNSSVERIAVPDLAATVEHMILTMTEVIRALVVDTFRMRQHANDPRTMMAMLQARMQEQFNLGPVEAGDLIRKHVRYDAEDNFLYIDGFQIAQAVDRSHGEVSEWWDRTYTEWERMD